MTRAKILIVTLALLVITSFYVRESVDEQREVSIQTTNVQLIDTVACKLASTLIEGEFDGEKVSDIEELIGEFIIWEIEEFDTYNQNNGSFEQVNIDEIDLQMIEYVKENSIPIINEIDDTVMVYTLIYDETYNPEAILKASYEKQSYGILGTLPEITASVILAMVLICALPIFVACVYIKKIKNIDKAMRKKGFYVSNKKGFSRVAKLAHIFSDMSSRILIHNKSIDNIKQSYEPFMPSELIKIFDKTDITELEVGQKKDIDAVILNIKSTNFLDVVKETDEKAVFEYVNQVFNTVIDEIESGFLINFNHVDSEILFQESLNDALKISSKIMKKIEEKGRTFDNKLVEYSFVAIKTKTNLGIVGSEKRSELLVLTSENVLYDELYNISKEFKTGVLFTSSTIKNKKNTRLIGQTTDKRYIYEDYSGKPSNKINLLNLTKKEFEQSVIAFMKDDIKSANAGFVSVIRKNNEDLMAYHYFEKCNEEVLVGS